MIFALAGNQNCGKTTLFNALTGSDQHVGNFPGVTVERKSGRILGREDCQAVDLPGIYSIRPYSPEEIISRDFILNEKPDCIINVADAGNPERNLYLTLQLLDLRVPMVLALNMMDEVRANGGSIDSDRLSELLGIPVIPISAAKDEGIEALVSAAVSTAEAKHIAEPVDLDSGGAVKACLKTISGLIAPNAAQRGLPVRFYAVRCAEGETDAFERLGLDREQTERIEAAVGVMEKALKSDRNAALAKARYDFIERVCAETVKKSAVSKGQLRSEKIDRILMNRYLAIPVFFGVMGLIFYLTFDLVGAWLQDAMAFCLDALAGIAESALTAHGAGAVTISLVTDGIFGGVGSVLSFLPVIIVLFLFLSVLEDSGYMARVAFVMDHLCRKIGLSGKSVVPMLIGFGCTVPAVMATRTLPSQRDRHLTLLLTPFMSCSAKIPIYSVFCTAFFPARRALVMCLLYFGGIIAGILYALLLKNTLYKGDGVPFVMELPNYRLSSPGNVAVLLWEKAGDFIERAFTVIFAAAILIWFLETFGPGFKVAENGYDSYLALIGRAAAPVFAPLGFGDWRAATALMTGFIAKEAVVSTLGVLMNAAASDAAAALPALFTSRSSLAFLTFALLYTPCAAALSSVHRELRSGTKTAAVMAAQCMIAWIASFAVYLTGGLFLP